MKHPNSSQGGVARTSAGSWTTATSLVLMGCLAGAAAFGTGDRAVAAQDNLIPIAVFDFELDDKSAGGGIIAQDDNDTQNLKFATDEAKRLLKDSGRYALVETTPVASEVAAAGGVLNCKSCEVPLARKLGADQAAIGVIGRVNRTEYTLFIRIVDTKTGAVIASDFTGLRMGANYSWPRGVKSLLQNTTLPGLPTK